jgi:arginine decarboxylase
VPTDPQDPLDLREDAPLVDGLLRFLESDVTPMHTPGHKARTERLGAVLMGDVTLYGGVDTIRGRHGRLEAAEAKAAALWGGDWARFSVAGSTHCNQALALSVAEPGDTVVVSRMLHRSLLLGLVLAGLRPVWVGPDVDASLGLPVGVPADAVRNALTTHPQAKAVFLVEPSYVGTVARLEDHAQVAHDHGVPLVVDQAWGGHFGFHPDVPPHALQLGADALVTSVHKALTGYTQSALLVARTDRLDPDRLTRGFDATHTTSPAGQIVASTDATRALLQRDGKALIEDAISIARAARQRLRGVPGLTVVVAEDLPTGVRFDPTKITLSLAGTGVDGVALDDDLADLGYPVEYSDRDTLVGTVTIFDDAEEIDGFVTALIDGIERHRGQPRTAHPHVAWTMQPHTVTRPRDAFFARHETVAADDAVGRVSAEIVAPYPPGVPVLAPGEEITAEALQALRDVKADGALVRYAADPTLDTFQVVAQ